MNNTALTLHGTSSNNPANHSGLLTVYLRHEISTDPIDKILFPRRISRLKDVVVYADKSCQKFLARFPWYYSNKPRKNSRTIRLNCCDWHAEWVTGTTIVDFAQVNPTLYKQRLLEQWGTERPTSFSIMEFFGTGSTKNDFILRESGKLTPDWISGDPVASFTSLDAAISAIQNIPNEIRRYHSVIGVLPSWN